MSTNSRRGNRTSIPASRGGMRRSNTPPPPSVRLGIDGLPELEPISTSRPRGYEDGDVIPPLAKPPADVVAAANLERVDLTTAKAPPVIPSSPALTAAVASNDAGDPVPAGKARSAGRDTLHSQPDSRGLGAVASALIELNEERPSTSEPLSDLPPSVAARKSKAPGAVASSAVTGAPGPTKRKSRSSNKKSAGASLSPPPWQALPSAGASVVTVADAHDAHEETDKVPAQTLEDSKPARVDTNAAAKALDVKAHEPVAAVADPTAHSVAAPSADLDQHFFDHGERAAAEAHAAHAEDAGDLDHYDEKMALKNSPEARERREKNWRYVLFASVPCLLLLLVAVVKGRSSHADVSAVDAPGVYPAAPATAAAGTGQTTAATAGKAQPDTVAVNVPAPSASEEALNGSAKPTAAGDSPSGSASAATASPPAQGTVPSTTGAPPPAKADELAVAAVAPSGPAAEPTEGDKKDAVREKRACQSLLDQGAFAKAVEAGEHSVALDPADGETWLMLGAAYQSMGKTAEARRSFSACVAEGKKGPLNECRAMLR